MITDEEMQKALEKVKEYCNERCCCQCNFCYFCEQFIETEETPRHWNIIKDDDR